MEYNYVITKVEELDASNLADGELSEFVNAEPIKIDPSDHLYDDNEPKLEEELIKNLIDGKVSFSEYEDKIFGDEQILSEEEEEEDVATSEPRKEATPSKSRNDEKYKFEKEFMKQQRDVMKGLFTQSLSTRKFKKSALPAALQGLMGEANLRYARGDSEVAAKVCLEIIRQVPLAVEPFLTLAQIYETSDPEKSMQFMLIAGHLNPNDADHWLRIAEMAEERGNYRQAVMSYSKAIAADPKDITLKMRRIEAAKAIGNELFVLNSELNMLPFIEDPELAMKTAREVAEKCNSKGKVDKALWAFKSVHEVYSEHFTTGDVNLFLELLLEVEDYVQALTVLARHTNTRVELIKTEQDEGGQVTVRELTIPDDLLVDFRSKLILSLVHLKATQYYELVVENVLAHMRVDDDGDCYLDIAEALSGEGWYALALRLIDPLVKSEKFSLAAVWLRHADCLRELEKFDMAIDSYKMVVELAPSHMDARLTLASLYKVTNQYEEALETLEQDMSSGPIEPTLLYEYCCMLKETGQIDKFIDYGSILFGRHSLVFRSRAEIESILSISSVKERRTIIKQMREFRLEEFTDKDQPQFMATNDEPDVNAEWALFKEVLHHCVLVRRYSTLQRLTYTALCSTRFKVENKEIKFMALLSTILNGDGDCAYALFRDFLYKNINNTKLWSLFNVIIQIMDAPKYFKSLMRILARVEKPIERQSKQIKANYALYSGNYLQALQEYSKLYQESRTPFLALTISVALCQMACQRFAKSRTDCVNQAIVFMADYAASREPEARQEVYYNTARLYQQLGMAASAVDYYKRVLAETTMQPRQMIDLKQEAAFNLHLIYKASGNIDLARKCLYDYIVV